MKRGNLEIKKPISVNWHFWPWCNMKCRFCFATFNDVKKVLPKKMALCVPKMLRDAGTEKITFVGGEPMLCPYLGELLIEAKKQGLKTKIVSNGTGFTKEFLIKYSQFIDQVSLSIDSASNQIEKELGRGWGAHVDKILKVSKLLKEFHIPMQINTTVTKLTYTEDLHELIKALQPFRWKVFQVLKIEGQNDGRVEELLITKTEYEEFKLRHKDIPIAVFEDNELITGSYIMLDPVGRFFDDTTGKHVYSESIFSVGVQKAFSQITWESQKFLKRGGLYFQSPLKKSFNSYNGNIIRS